MSLRGSCKTKTLEEFEHFHTSLTTGMLDKATAATGDTRVTSNVALKAGSSQQGKALRASVDSNCVTAMCFLLPSPAER